MNQISIENHPAFSGFELGLLGRLFKVCIILFSLRSLVMDASSLVEMNGSGSYVTTGSR